MPIINPFTDDAFNFASLSIAINKIPNTYGRVNELGLFSDVGVRSRTLIVEAQNGVLNLLPTMPRGAPSSVAIHGDRNLRAFVIPHIPHDDVVMPEDAQGLRAFGSETELESLSNLIEFRLSEMRAKHSITLEHLRIGALKGIILDADGSTLFNLYTEFGITPKVVDFALNNAATDVLAKTLEVRAYIEDNLRGEVMTGVRGLCSPEFFAAFVAHAKVQNAYSLWREGEFMRSDNRKGFTFGGVTFEEYRGQATDGLGNVRRFIAAKEAHFFPEGTMSTFRTYYAPADFNETVNTIGRPIYAKQEPRPMGRGTDLHTQSNPLPMSHRPEVLVKGTTP